MKASRELLHSVSMQRRLTNRAGILFLYLLSTLALLPLILVFTYVIIKGAPSLSWNFFTELPAPMGSSGGGMANALLGSVKMVFFAGLLAVPMGMTLGVYLSEYGSDRIAKVLRTSIDLMLSVPSIVVGLFVYGMVVVPMKSFSGYAGLLALAFIMLPVMTKSTEEILRLVPIHVREAGLALGLPRWKVILFIVVRGCKPGIATAVILSVARVAGETAPLLLTAFGNRFWSTSLAEPTAALPVQIYAYAISPFPQQHAQAWAGAFLLLLVVFCFNLVSRWIILRQRN